MVMGKRKFSLAGFHVCVKFVRDHEEAMRCYCQQGQTCTKKPKCGFFLPPYSLKIKSDFCGVGYTEIVTHTDVQLNILCLLYFYTGVKAAKLSCTCNLTLVSPPEVKICLLCMHNHSKTLSSMERITLIIPAIKSYLFQQKTAFPPN